MAVEIVPTTSQAFFTQRTRLDGVDYFLRFQWNQREAKWYLSLYDESESPIVEGVKLVTDWNLLASVIDTRRPPGQLRIVDLEAQELTSNPRRDPTFEGFGTRWVLAYLDAAELASLGG